jgi:hypothetical protein
MTVQAGIELDLELMLGEVEAPSCESIAHTSDTLAHSGPGTHYVNVHHGCTGPSIQVRCQAFIKLIQSEGATLSCRYCGNVGAPDEFLTILGPISDYR